MKFIQMKIDTSTSVRKFDRNGMSYHIVLSGFHVASGIKVYVFSLPTLNVETARNLYRVSVLYEKGIPAARKSRAS